MAKFNTKWERRVTPPESGYGPSKAEQTGAIPIVVRIKQMEAAGRRLAAIRQEQYDYPDDLPVDLAIEDVTRMRGLDLVDIEAATKAIAQRMYKARKDKWERIKAEQRAKIIEEIKAEADKAAVEGTLPGTEVAGE